MTRPQTYFFTSKRAILFLTFFLMFLVFFYSSNIRTLLIAVVSLLLFLCIISLKNGYLKLSNSNYLFLLMVLIQMIDVISDLLNGNSILSSLAYLIIFALLYIASINIKDANTYEKVLWITFLIAFIGGPLAGFYQLITKKYIFDFFSSQEQAQFNGIEYLLFSANNGNSDYASMHMMVSMFLSIILFKKRKNWFYLLTTIISFVALIMTFSRATIIGVVFSFALYVVFRRKTNKNKKVISKIIKFIAFLIPLFIIAFLIFLKPILTIISDYISNPYALENFKYKLSGEGLNSRNIIWSGVFKLMGNSNCLNLFFGYGSNYSGFLEEYTGKSISAHNFLLGQFATAGLIGLLVSIIFFIYAVKKAYIFLHSRDSELVFYGMLLFSFLFNYLFVSIYDMVFIVFLFLITIKCNKLSYSHSFSKRTLQYYYE